MPRHSVILTANEVRNHDSVKAAEMVEALILEGDSTAPAGGAYDLLGQIYLKAGDLLSARDSFQKNLEIYPDSDGTYCYMGLIEQILGNSSKSEEWYSKCPDRGFDPPYVDMIRSSFKKWEETHPDAKNRIALLASGIKPPSLGDKTITTRSPTMESCPKCGRREPKLTAVIDYATMSEKLLCSQCARATMGPGSFGINMGGHSKKWWQFWKKRA